MGPKEVVVRIFITLKNPSSSAGFEPLGPVASTLALDHRGRPTKAYGIVKWVLVLNLSTERVLKIDSALKARVTLLFHVGMNYWCNKFSPTASSLIQAGVMHSAYTTIDYPCTSC
jgi:hypothetical protein